MLKFIEKVRSRPESDRNKILIVSVVMLMAFVVFLWAVNLDSVLKTEPSGDDGVNATATSPFEIFSEKVSSLLGAISQ